MVRTQVSLDEEAYRAAKREARRQGISLAELFRRALARALTASRGEAAQAPGGGERAWMRYSGVLDSGDPDSSLSVDAVVYGRERP